MKIFNIIILLVLLISAASCQTSLKVAQKNINWTQNVSSQIHGVTNGTAAQDVTTVSQQTYIDVRSYGAVCDGNTDDSHAIEDAIIASIGMGGKPVYFPEMCSVSREININGTIPTSATIPDAAMLSLISNGVGGVKTTATSGNVFKLGSAASDMEFKLGIKDFVVDCNEKNVVAINGTAENASHNNFVQFENLVIRRFSGADSAGIICGSITDSTLMNVRVFGGANGHIGISPRRSNTKLIDCLVEYCKHDIYVAPMGEASVQMIGGALLLPGEAFITWGGNEYYYNSNYLIGTFIGENTNDCPILTVEDADPFDVNTLLFDGVYFDSDKLAEPMIDLRDFPGSVTFRNCAGWWNATAHEVWKGQYTKLYFDDSNRILTVNTSQSAMHLLNYVGYDINAAGGYKQTLSFYQDDVAAGQSGISLGKNAGTRTGYLMNYPGSIVAIGVHTNGPRSAGTLTVQPAINGVGVAGESAVLGAVDTTYDCNVYNKDAYAFAAGDVISCLIYTDGSWAPTTADITVEVVIEY